MTINKWTHIEFKYENTYEKQQKSNKNYLNNFYGTYK